MGENIRAILGLSRLKRVGRVKVKAILDRLKGEPIAGLRLSDLVARFSDGLPPVTPHDVDVSEAQADEILERCYSLGITIHVYTWPTYPPQLTRLREPPAFLFSIGKFDYDRKPRIAVIGTRHPTDWGVETAQKCAAKIVEAEGVVVSGLALGIDAAAQAATIEHRGPTWAVLAHGLHTVSPSSNRELARQIVEKGGALVSEYPPGEAAQRHYFVERDRIQAGLSDAVLVIESGINGGAMHTVRFAQQAGVSVWVTFPETKIHGAQTDFAALPEAQQGTWELWREKQAVRVTTMRTLNNLMHNLKAAAESATPQ